MHPFIDSELIEQSKLIKNNKIESSDLEEHQFIANCLYVGLRIEDLKTMEYVDIAKIFISLLPSDKKYRKATAEDWQNIM